MKRSSRRFVGRMVLIVAGSCVLGLAANRVSPRGIDLTADYRPAPPPTPGGAAAMEALLEKLESTQVIIVDARAHETYLKGHIPNAVSLPLARHDDVAPLFLALAGGKEVITYCSGPACLDSTRLAGLLVEDGLPNVTVFRGGWQEWLSAGKPVERGPGKVSLVGSGS